jgi:hypothetical protein
MTAKLILRVVCAYTTLHPETERALRVQAEAPEFADVSGDVTDYCATWARLWRAQEDFVMVEHDIVIAPGTIDAFSACPELWCCVSTGALGAAFQCNRFRRELIVAHPDLFDLPAYGRHWVQLDSIILGRLLRAGERPHLHADLPTTHHHDDSPEYAARVNSSFNDWLAGFADDAPRLLAEGIADDFLRNRIALAPIIVAARRPPRCYDPRPKSLKGTPAARSPRAACGCREAS